ncbi:MAG: hypothetical protein KGO53_01980 [Alphaproteobacteria bacterium]|nr:hypothetical protein [Alphaproteobacteria bacterium]
MTAATLVAAAGLAAAPAEAQPWHHWRWHHHHYWGGPVFAPMFWDGPDYRVRCWWRHSWRHGWPVNVRVCRPVYW